MARFKEEPSHRPIAELMAREGLTLRVAATRLQLALSSEEAANLFRTKGFQKLLQTERYRFFREIAADPEWSKRTAIGQMLYANQRLMEQGEYSQVIEGVLKVAKLEGWIGSESTVNVFGGLSQLEMDGLRESLLKEVSKLGGVN